MGCVLLSGWIELIVYTIYPNRILKKLLGFAASGCA
jgi:hypothetical protein